MFKYFNKIQNEESLLGYDTLWFC